MNVRRAARLVLPPAFVLTVLTVPRTPRLGAGVHVLAGWSGPSSQPAGTGADPDAAVDAGVDAGEDAGDAGPGPETLCGADNGLATTSTLGAGCC